MLRALLSLLAGLALLAVSGRADAHAVGLSRGDYAFDAGRVTVAITFARGDAAALAVDGVPTRIAVQAGGAACAPTLDGTEPTTGDGLMVRASYRCDAQAGDATVDLTSLLEDLPRGHRHIAHLSGSQQGDRVLFAGRAELRLARASARSSTPAERTQGAGLLAFVRMGITHILTGYDHLFFLLGLVVVGSSLGALLRVVSAFTVAHSLTLAVAALGLWTPSSRIVEPLIALSIAYVGVENLCSKNLAKRWRLTFAFGLIHGFGFASALRDVAVSGASVPAALLGFNVGVEVGQLAVLALVLPLVLLARRARWLEGARARLPSLGIAAAGAVWFVARLAQT